MTGWLQALADLIKNNIWIAPLLCLAAGIITSFTPCSLSSVPMVIAYIGGTAPNNQKQALRLSLVMALGMAVTFGALGSLASVIGRFMHEVGMWWYLVLGAVMILMALQIGGVITLIPDWHRHREITQKGYVGAFMAGILSGFFASHCATPVMIALLAIAAESGSTVWGIFLLALYAAGHSILLIVAGTSYSTLERWINDPKYEKISTILKRVMGMVILLIGLAMIYFAFMPD